MACTGVAATLENCVANRLPARILLSILAPDMDESPVALWEVLHWSLRPADLLDISVVACLLYLGLTWLRRRGTFSAIALLGSVLVLYVLAHRLNMYLTLALFQVGITVLVLGFLIVYQEEVRAGLERLISRRSQNVETVGQRGESLIGNLSEALTTLADTHTGALIVLRGREPLERYIRGGIVLNGRVSVPLLLSLFNHKSPAHDGAVILRGDLIERFATHLPLSANLNEVGERGTRHTAAIGLSERCDALVLVVSEERGKISISQQGRLCEIPSLAELRRVLQSFTESIHQADRRPLMRMASLGQWATGVVAIVAAVVLWSPFATQGDQNMQQTLDVPVALVGAEEGWIVSPPDSATVEVTLSGSSNAFSLLDPEKLRQTIDLPRMREGWRYVVVDPDQLEGLPDGLTVVDIRPERIGFASRPAVEHADAEDRE